MVDVRLKFGKKKKNGGVAIEDCIKGNVKMYGKGSLLDGVQNIIWGGGEMFKVLLLWLVEGRGQSFIWRFSIGFSN